MEKYYEFAGIQIAITAPDQMMYTQDGVLESFRVRNVSEPYRVSFEFVDMFIAPSGHPMAVMDYFSVYYDNDVQVRYVGAVDGNIDKAYIRIAYKKRKIHVQLKRSVFGDNITVETVLNSICAEHLIAGENGFILHASYIRVGEEGVLFTAPSGTGKSTQANLWHTLRGTEILNGDRSAVRLYNGQIFASGIPFAGSSQICENVTLPLKAIVYLSQNEDTKIRRLQGAEAFRRVWEGISVNIWDKDDISKVMDVVQQTVLSIPVYHLSCTPDESAVIALEQALGKEGYHD